MVNKIYFDIIILQSQIELISSIQNLIENKENELENLLNNLPKKLKNLIELIENKDKKLSELSSNTNLQNQIDDLKKLQFTKDNEIKKLNEQNLSK